MSKQPRTRRIAKWTGLVLCFLIAVAWGVSLRWFVVRKNRKWSVGLLGGEVLIHICDKEPNKWSWGPYEWHVDPHPAEYGFPLYSLKHWGLCPPTRSVYTSKWLGNGVTCSMYTVPFWLPLLMLAPPTAMLWRYDRKRIPPGHCQQCGYFLTGNTSGICPECGTPVPEDVKKTLALAESGPSGDQPLDPAKREAP